MLTVPPSPYLSIPSLVRATGVVMYIMLVGSHPFDPTGDSSDEQILRRAADPEASVPTVLYCCHNNQSIAGNRRHGALSRL